jgi:deoxycytidine triphosphate deaminase
VVFSLRHSVGCKLEKGRHIGQIFFELLDHAGGSARLNDA